MKMEEILNSVKTMNQKDREQLIEKLSEKTPEKLRADISSTVHGMVITFGTLDVEKWEDFQQTFYYFSEDLNHLGMLINNYNSFRVKQRAKEVEKTVQQFVDQGLEFHKLQLDGIEVSLKDGRVINDSDIGDDIPF